MKRSGYRDVTKQLGKALRMNWAYGVEFIEVDPMVLGIEKFGEDQEAAERAQMMQAERVDKARIRVCTGPRFSAAIRFAKRAW